MKKLIVYVGWLLVALPLAAQPAPLTVTEYKQKVLDYSRQIKQSAEQRMAMQEAMRTAKTGYFPKLDFSGSAQYRINDYNMDFGGTKIPMENETYSLEAGLTQNLYSGRAVHHSYKAAEIQKDIAVKAEELTVDNIIYSADVNYWATVAKKDLYLVMRQYVKIIRELEKVLTDRFRDGYISKTDLLQVQARLKDAELQKSNAFKQYQIALQNLNVLMGMPPAAPVEVTDSINMMQALPPEIGMEAAFASETSGKVDPEQIFTLFVGRIEGKLGNADAEFGWFHHVEYHCLCFPQYPGFSLGIPD